MVNLPLWHQNSKNLFQASTRSCDRLRGGHRRPLLRHPVLAGDRGIDQETETGSGRNRKNLRIGSTDDRRKIGIRPKAET